MDQTHWNQVYQTKAAETVSWYEAYPQRSVDTIVSFGLSPQARLIDVGGGDSRLVDALLDLGFVNLTVLDISMSALERAKRRLGNRADLVSWIVADITSYQPDQPFDIWHDRAAFHFLTTPAEVARYLAVAKAGIKTGGILTVGTFAENGPTHCSGLPVRQYAPDTLARQFSAHFTKRHCETTEHQTPSGAKQAFTFCQFERK
ncbi:trans-aconitate 2-methyltransferase [Fibrella sp. WM1]|uniref:class I SAM-dependent methyltransferase n=1 Tax=Fibrella musci TaxID=3242485 RepID=UPI003520DF8D